MTITATRTLVDAVSEAIAERDHAAASRFDRVFTKQPADDQDAIIALNQYWRKELTGLSVSTISERECLIDMIEPSDWLRHFRRQVLPLIWRFQLPASA